MLIGKKWKIEADSMNVTLLRRGTARKGKNSGSETWIIVGHYSSVKNALKALVDQGARDTELTDLMTIVAKIEELHKLIEDIAK